MTGRFHVPPKRTLYVDYADLVAGLEQELPAAARPGFHSVLQLLANITAIDHVAQSRSIRRAMAPFQQRSAVRGAAAGGSGAAYASVASISTDDDGSPADSDAAQQDFLDRVVELLLAARYAPLTAAQWHDARNSVFTFGEGLRGQSRSKAAFSGVPRLSRGLGHLSLLDGGMCGGTRQEGKQMPGYGIVA